jgi:putative protein-disulfide isomerase
LDYRLYYFHDPMCSWCWGYRPTWQRLQATLPEEVGVQYVLGGLAPDSDEPMPAAMRVAVEGHWRQIQNLLGTEFNFAFWRHCHPRRDTYKACRALIAARATGLEMEMLEAIQRAYYLRALNPSETDVLVQLAVETGMQAEPFRSRLLAAETEQQLQDEINLTRAWQVQGFPSLLLRVAERNDPLPVDYRDEEVTLARLRRLLEQTR